MWVCFSLLLQPLRLSLGGLALAAGFGPSPSTLAGAAGWSGSSSGQTLSTQLWKWVPASVPAQTHLPPLSIHVHTCFFFSPLCSYEDLIDRVGLFDWMCCGEKQVVKPSLSRAALLTVPRISQTQSLGSCSVNVHNQFPSRWNYSSRVCI